MTHEERDHEGLLAWQLAGYPDVHGDRRNVLIHILTVPMFLLGNVAVLTAPFTSAWRVLVGLALTVAAIELQGRGHRFEPRRPAPFRGPIDVVLRILGEQWITFPRFVLTGGFARAWGPRADAVAQISTCVDGARDPSAGGRHCRRTSPAARDTR
jgi:uncharacterized membrane protein YGL010W